MYSYITPPNNILYYTMYEYRVHTLLSFMMTPGEVAIVVVPRFARCIASVEYTIYPLRLYFFRKCVRCSGRLFIS